MTRERGSKCSKRLSSIKAQVGIVREKLESLCKQNNLVFFGNSWQIVFGGKFCLDMAISAKAQATKAKRPFERHTRALSQHLGTRVSERCRK